MKRPNLATPYAEYLDLTALYALQALPDDPAHADELQFRTVHLVSELWLRLETSELERAATALEAAEPLLALRLLDRAQRIGGLLVEQLQLLNTMSLHDYHSFRAHLGTASGLQSPGYQLLRQAAGPLWAAFSTWAARSSIDLTQADAAAHTLAQSLIERMVNLDTALQQFLFGHLKLAERFLGPDSPTTGGMGLSYLRQAVEQPLFAELNPLRSQSVRQLLG